MENGRERRPPKGIVPFLCVWCAGGANTPRGKARRSEDPVTTSPKSLRSSGAPEVRNAFSSQLVPRPLGESGWWAPGCLGRGGMEPGVGQGPSSRRADLHCSWGRGRGGDSPQETGKWVPHCPPPGQITLESLSESQSPALCRGKGQSLGAPPNPQERPPKPRGTPGPHLRW